ncbi:TPA: hypothetical protein G9F26_003958 [Salmonella enterica]|uniref:Uncharacterized protein n=1 Tax=Salmonella enterica TaxID=28901 RepID=A0A750HZE3_SALER|nr:hypothetical protein [Salmonella enterica]
MFKSKLSAVAGFVKKNATPSTLAGSAVAGLGVAASSVFAAAGDPTPFTLTSAMIQPVITALSTNFGVAVASAFGLLTITLVGKAAFGAVKGMISRAL